MPKLPPSRPNGIRRASRLVIAKRPTGTDFNLFPERISLNPDPLNIIAGSTVQLLFTVVNPRGETISPPSVQYSTSDGTKATVNSSGLVTGAAPGTCTITALIPAYSGVRPTDVAVTINVTVTDPTPAITSVGITPRPTSAIELSQQQYVVTAQYSSGPPGVPPGAAWSIQSGGGSIDANGLATRPAYPGGPQVVRVDVGAHNDTVSTAITATPVPPPSSGAPILEEIWDYIDSDDLKNNYNGQGPFTRTFSDYFGGHAGFLKKSTTDPYPSFSVPRDLFYLETGDPVFGKCCGMLHLATDAFPLGGLAATANGPSSVMRWSLPNTVARGWIERYIRFNDATNRWNGGPSPSQSPGWTTVNTLPAGVSNSYKITAENYVGGVANGATSFQWNNQRWREVFQGTDDVAIDWHNHNSFSETMLGTGYNQLPVGNVFFDFGGGSVGMPVAAPNNGWFRFIKVFWSISTTECVIGTFWRRYSDGAGNILSEAAHPWSGKCKRFVRTTGAATCPIGFNAIINGQNYNRQVPFTQTIFHGPTRVWNGDNDYDPLGLFAQFGITP